MLRGVTWREGQRNPRISPPPTRVVYCSTFQNRKGKLSRSSDPSKEPLDMAVIEQRPFVGFPLQWEIGKIKHPGREGSDVLILPSYQGCFVCQKGNYLGCCLIRQMKCRSGLAEAQAWMGFAHSQAAPPGCGPGVTSCLVPLLVTAGSVQGLRPSVVGLAQLIPRLLVPLAAFLQKRSSCAAILDVSPPSRQPPAHPWHPNICRLDSPAQHWESPADAVVPTPPPVPTQCHECCYHLKARLCPCASLHPAKPLQQPTGIPKGTWSPDMQRLHRNSHPRH